MSSLDVSICITKIIKNVFCIVNVFYNNVILYASYISSNHYGDKMLNTSC